MDPDEVTLENLTKNFEYVKFSNQIDTIDNTEDLRNLAKCYFKLYLKQQEIVSEWSVSKP
jgi:putative heme degradation protein